MEVVTPIDLTAVSALSTTRRLDDGEREAIALALGLHADVVLMDERRGVACARELGLHVIRTPLIYAEAGARGLISDLRAKLDMLRGAGFYLSERHYQLVLDAIDAGRPPS